MPGKRPREDEGTQSPMKKQKISAIHNNQVTASAASGAVPQVQGTAPTAPSRQLPAKLNANSKDWKEIQRIIHWKHNVKPDPFGTESTTSGPLTWEQVRRLYNHTYGKNITTSQAVQKRYIQSIVEYCQLFPEYPPKEQIIYLGTEETEPVMEQQVTEPEQQDAESGTEDPKDPLEETENDKHWRKYNFYALDIERYFNRADPIVDEQRPYWMLFKVKEGITNSAGKPWMSTSTNAVPLSDIQRSSKYVARVLENCLLFEPELEDVSKTTIQRYIQCISPEPRAQLPDFDWRLQRRQINGREVLQSSLKVIDWTTESLIDLLKVAALLEDELAIALVVDHWVKLLKAGTLELLDPDSMNFVFSVDGCSRVRQFWNDVIETHSASVHFQRGYPDPKRTTNSQGRRVLKVYSTLYHTVSDEPSRYSTEFEDLASHKLALSAKARAQIFQKYLSFDANDDDYNEEKYAIYIASRLLFAYSIDHPDVVNRFREEHMSRERRSQSDEPLSVRILFPWVNGSKELANCFTADDVPVMQPDEDYDDVVSSEDEMVDSSSSDDWDDSSDDDEVL